MTINELFGLLAGVASTQGVDIGVGLLVTALGFYYNQMIISPASRARLATALEEKSPLQRYRSVLSGALDWVDRVLARDPKRDTPEEMRRAFSTRLFEVSLTLALLYPAVLLLSFWAVNVSSARVGLDFVILEDSAEPSERVLALLALIVTLILALMARAKRRRASSEWTEFCWLIVAVLVVTAGVFAVIEGNVTAASADAERRELLSTAVITSIAAAVTVAAAGALRGATALAVSVLIAGATVLVWELYGDAGGGATSDQAARFFGALGESLGFGRMHFLEGGVERALIIGAVLSVLFMLAAAAPSTWRGGAPFWAKGALLRAFAFMIGSAAGASLGVLALGGEVSVMVALGYGLGMFAVILLAQIMSGSVRALSDWIGSPAVSFLLFATYLAAAGGLFAWLAAQPAVDANLRMYFTIFAFLPALNVAFDFLTAGATRYALRRGLAGDDNRFPLFWTLLDMMVAGLLFVLLGLAMVAAAEVVRLAGDAPLIDSIAVMNDLRNDVGAYSWLVVAMLSTLAPTVAHLAIAIFSIVLFFWSGVSGWVARRVRDGADDGAARAVAVILLTAFTIASVAIPVFVFAALAVIIGAQTGMVGDAYLDLLQRFAAALSGE